MKSHIPLFWLSVLLLASVGIIQPARAAGAAPLKPKLNRILSQMTLKEKVGQLFIVDLARLNKHKPVTALTPEIKTKLHRYNFGGIILFSNNLQNRKQILSLIRDLRNAQKLPLFLCIDEEGGRVSRLEQTAALGLKKLPNAEIIGQREDSEYAYRIGETLARQLQQFGFNVDFAPVVDINTNPENTVIGARAFGNTPEEVSEMATAVIRGLQDNRIMACAKHFPGHGDTSTDTHHALAFIRHRLPRLRQEEFIPFKAAISSGVMSIMLAHIVAPEITGNNLPATMSKTIVTDILRTELAFKGLIITDALMMKAITDNYTTADVCLQAITAGVDLLLMPDNIAEGYNAVLQRARTDRNFAARVEESASRIIAAKIQLNLFPAYR